MSRNYSAVATLLACALFSLAACDGTTRRGAVALGKALGKPSAAATEVSEPHERAPQPDGRRLDYVLAVTWMPEFCASERPGDPRCQDQSAWRPHGLWPKPFDGGSAEDCPTTQQAEGFAVIHGVAVLGSADLARHQWRKHGSCTSLSPAEYFARMKRLMGQLHAPASMLAAGPTTTWTLNQYEAAWQQANPQLDGARLAVRCKNGWLYELLFCFDDAERLTRCPSSTRDNCPRGGFGVRGGG